MSQQQGTGPLLPHGGYRELRSYKVAEAVYDDGPAFWGCPGYPECKGSLSISSDRSDRSERSD